MDVLTTTGVRLRSRLDLAKIWPDFLVWLAVSVVTLGLRWLVICIVTLGAGLLFYSFFAARAAMNHTRVEWD